MSGAAPLGAFAAEAATTRRPRVGLAGTGWIGRLRLEALLAADVVDVAAVADPAPAALEEAARLAPRARARERFEHLLEEDLDGLVIATPSALHAEQAVAALERGLAVFCQKPLGRDRREVRRVLAAARAADRLLSIDLCYRHARAARAVRGLVSDGEIGDVYAADLVFHNAYGPDRAWFYDPALSGGGCLMDLGVHLVDLALWTLGFPEVEAATARLFRRGEPWRADGPGVEDYAEARLDLAGGRSVRIACSWGLPAGRDAVIEASFYGPRGGARMRNLGGSFFDLVAERLEPRRTTRLVDPPDPWGGRALVEWAERLGVDGRFDPAAEEIERVAETVDRMYGSAACGS